MARRRKAGRRKRGARRPRRFVAVALWLAVLALAVHFALSPPRVVRRWWSEREGLARVEGHAEALRLAARENGLDPNLLAGVMMVESRGRVDAESSAGALGLFQLMLPTAQERAELLRLPPPSKRTLLGDALLNTRLGAHYLAWLLARYGGDEERALIAYNAGPGRLKRWIDEAGSYAAWRDAREHAGDSEVLAYAQNVQHYRQRFADRAVIAPGTVREADHPALGPELPAAPSVEPSPELVGPPAPLHQ